MDVAGIKAGIAICYDGAFPEHSRQAVQDGANLLIVVTNDTWAGSTSAPFWHLKASAFRAIETGRYIIHASQSGPSAIITGSGKILEATSRGQATALTNSVIPHYTQTLYVRLGNWIGLLCFGTTVIMLILTLKKALPNTWGHKVRLGKV